MGKKEFDEIAELIQSRHDDMTPTQALQMVRAFEVISRGFAKEANIVLISGHDDKLSLTVINADEAEVLDMLGVVFTSVNAAVMHGSPERELFN